MVDFGILGHVAFTWEFALGVISVIFIDIVLAGDNAVVIAMAAQTVPQNKRRATIIFGAGLAVLLRVFLAFFASQLLMFGYVRLVGGLLIMWIALKLLTEDAVEQENTDEARSIWQAVWIIMAADAGMSLDNVLALAGASQGNIFLLIFGLGLSIPLVIFASTILAKLMDRYPVILYLGAAVLGKVAAELIFTDIVVKNWVVVPKTGLYALEVAFAAGIVLIGLHINRRKTRIAMAQSVVRPPVVSVRPATEDETM